MNIQGMTRFIIGTRSASRNEKAINDFMLFIGSGEEQYKPMPEKNTDNTSQIE